MKKNEEKRRNKVFISFLGVNNYKETYYSTADGKKTDKPIRFVQEALLRLLYTEGWCENDKVFIFCTKKAKERNWDDETSDKKGLHSILQSMKDEGYKPKCEECDIVEGFSEDQIWDIFETIYNKIEPDDELYLDITYAFRSIPFFSVALFNYSEYFKKARLVDINYGAFEKLGPSYEIEKIPVEDRNAPIINLNSIIDLQKFIMVANDFKKFGKLGQLTSYIDNNGKGKQLIHKLCTSINTFEDDISTCRGNFIIEGKTVTDIKNKIDEAIEKEKQPIKEILQDLELSLSLFSVESQKNIERVIDWCKKYKMTQQAYTFGEEYIITVVCKMFEGLNPFKNKAEKPEKKFREYIASILGIGDDIIKNKFQWHGNIIKYEELSDAIIGLDWIKELRKSYCTIETNRNHINHAGFIEKDKSKNLIEQLDEPLKQCIEIINRKDLEMPKYKKASSAILINLSNHPYSTWSEKQKEASRVYGKCEDVEFPQIDASSDMEDIQCIVKEYLTKIKDLSAGKQPTVHLMGEMTFCYALLVELQKRNIPCIASTTTRVIKELEPGKKLSIFDFQRFREYK